VRGADDTFKARDDTFKARDNKLGDKLRLLPIPRLPRRPYFRLSAPRSSFSRFLNSSFISFSPLARKVTVAKTRYIADAAIRLGIPALDTLT
jgi:hypothetical protein